MDWFERLTGFIEAGYDETRRKLELQGPRLSSKVNGRSFEIGELELVSLAELRERLGSAVAPVGRLRFSNVIGDVRKLHLDPQFAGALFQVASQFNLLEMVGPNVTPEDGVTRYACDRTQGPACALAAGAATIYRNYFALVGDQVGQTSRRQLDGLSDVGEALSEALGRPADPLWAMRNGYALPSKESLSAISTYLRGLDEGGLDELRGRLRIGAHRNVEVTDAPAEPGPCVSQAFCSAIPVSYAGIAGGDWRPFAQLVLDAAYEATLIEGVLNARSGRSEVVLLTRLGGGAFGNDDRWIDHAIERALNLASGFALDVRLVSYGAVPTSMHALEAKLSG